MEIFLKLFFTHVDQISLNWWYFTDISRYINRESRYIMVYKKTDIWNWYFVMIFCDISPIFLIYLGKKDGISLDISMKKFHKQIYHAYLRYHISCWYIFIKIIYCRLIYHWYICYWRYHSNIVEMIYHNFCLIYDWYIIWMFSNLYNLQYQWYINQKCDISKTLMWCNNIESFQNHRHQFWITFGFNLICFCWGIPKGSCHFWVRVVKKSLSSDRLFKS